MRIRTLTFPFQYFPFMAIMMIQQGYVFDITVFYYHQYSLHSICNVVINNKGFKYKCKNFAWTETKLDNLGRYFELLLACKAYELVTLRRCEQFTSAECKGEIVIPINLVII